jgi:putative flippase GtrA
MSQFFSKEFVVYLCTGGTAAGVNFASRWIYNHWLDYSYSVLFAYATGMTTAFILARLFVFKNSTQSLSRSTIFFVLVNIVTGIQTWAISMFLAVLLLPKLGFTQFVPEIAHAVGIAIPVFTSYLGHKHFSFR